MRRLDTVISGIDPAFTDELGGGLVTVIGGRTWSCSDSPAPRWAPEVAEDLRAIAGVDVPVVP